MNYIRGLGTHLLTTLVGCEHYVLTYEKGLEKWLKNFPPKINMSVIEVEGKENPIVFSCFSPKNPDNYGYSGFVLLHESHVSIHCWPIENSVDIDIFSCYPYDTGKAMNELKSFFGGHPVNTSIVTRGHGFI